jgi:hypothetical protein
MLEAQTKPTPLGIMDSLNAGFGVAAQKLNLLLIPFMLDLFLWLGPRLSPSPIVSELTARFRAVAGEMPQDSAAFVEQNIAEIFGSYNLFSALSTWPLGVPSLLAGSELGANPLGTPPVIQVHGLNALLVWLFSLALVGLLAGSFYMGLIARWVGKSRASLRTWLKRTWLHWARIVAFVLVVLLCSFFLSVPLFLLAEVAAIIFPPLATLVLLIGVGAGMWGVFHLFFTVHGILLDDMKPLPAMRHSTRLVCQHRASSVGLVLITVVISLGLSTIWHMPPPDSWLRLTAIAGNAFVNTGLTAATFVYYRERTSDLLEDKTPRSQE